mgnify:CR=1 FL=1
MGYRWLLAPESTSMHVPSLSQAAHFLPYLHSCLYTTVCSGAAQAGVICYLLFQLTQGVDGYFANKALPEQYTAHNVAVLVQTVVRGLAYLITFIFGANALGLTGERRERD